MGGAAAQRELCEGRMEGLKETAPSGPLWARLAVALGRQLPQQIKHWAHPYVVLRKARTRCGSWWER
jgi:hypothetical protein